MSSNTKPPMTDPPTTEPRRQPEFVFDAYSSDVGTNPYPFYETMRASYPVLWCDSTQAWALSRYDDVLQAVLDTATFSSAKGNVVADNPARAGRTLGTTDPPRHDQLRKLVNDAFARRTVADYGPAMREMAEEALEALLSSDDDVVDLRVGFAFPSSAAVLGSVLGVDLLKQESLASAFTTVLDEPLPLGADPSTDKPERAAAMAEVLAVVTDTMAARRRHPGDDVVSSLIQAGLVEDDLMWIVFTFLGAGLESSTAQFLLSARALGLFPDARAALAADHGVMETAVEELIRYDCGPQRFHRTLTHDLELHGQHMRAGDSVLVMYGSANRDEQKFDRADQLVLDRYPNRHMGFGRGAHFCLGAPLARLQSEILFRVLLDAAPSYRVLEDELEWKANPGFRGPKTLPVVLRP